ncbi:unnamed protein product [Arabis nemorensis]|uniref:Uncharacterized protein n=1 Tax=Arabis nemorensis TaxID=586526 RepID=A0A565B596_9BRAS|nr:unnamed protein product [Arabis nemorensis]
MNSHQLNHFVDELIMAEAEAVPDTSDLVDLKHISAPLFSIPGFFVGFGAKGTHDSDAGKSPTSPLDFGVFANFGGLFSPRSPAPSSPRFSQRNKWVCDKIGLSVLSSMASSIGDEGGQSDSFRRENIVLAPQIKVNVDRRAERSSKLFDDPCVKSNSLPKNFSAASLSDAINIQSNMRDSITDVWDTTVVEERNSPRRSSSSPMDIISSQAYSRSLSGREMALSEDYTCIISHGPNPKTTHIFGDCILDCDPKELGGLGTKEDIEKPEGDSLPNFLDDSLSQLCSCTGKPQDCQNIHIDSEVSAEKEPEEGGVEDSLNISPGSSYTEDLFPMAMPLNP